MENLMTYESPKKKLQKTICVASKGPLIDTASVTLDVKTDTTCPIANAQFETKIRIDKKTP